jgi:hypothetical protein
MNELIASSGEHDPNQQQTPGPSRAADA